MASQAISCNLLIRNRPPHIQIKISNTFHMLLLSNKGNSNVELGTAICYVNVENYFLTIIKHIAVPSSKLEFPF